MRNECLFLLLSTCLLPFSLPAQPLSFPQGVASGDPLPTQVIIWTRALPSDGTIEANGNWQIATDSSFQDLVQADAFRTSAARDFTVKIDVQQLSPDQEYYYRFGHAEGWSPVGRTRTAPTGPVDRLQFAVVSCNNYMHGYFGAYRVIAEMDTLQAVIHLGDYIYESQYGSSRRLADRTHRPAHKLISLADYRARYAQYRSDPDLQAAHQRHPFILVWDDHESSNNAAKDGAQGHQLASDGPWPDRLAAATQAYYEWMPIREGGPLYRQFSFGDLADLYMVDTRIEGREPQIYDVADTALYAPERTLLGAAQRDWLLQSMQTGPAQWQLLGNQVVFSPLYGDHISRRLENAMLDIWDGYPAERARLIDAWQAQSLQNLIVLTGDFHVSMAFEIPPRDWNFPLKEQDTQQYNAEAAVGVEYTVPSITSHNFDEFAQSVVKLRGVSQIGVKYLEKRMQKEARKRKDWPGRSQPINPHLRYINLRSHGFLLLELTPEAAYSTYFLQKRVDKPDSFPRPVKRFKTPAGQAKVIEIEVDRN